MPSLSQAPASYRRHLFAEGRKPQTVKRYLAAIRAFQQMVGDKDVSEVSRDDVRKSLARRPHEVSITTVSIEFRAPQDVVRWLTEEGEIDHVPTDRMRGPKVPEPPPALCRPRRVPHVARLLRPSHIVGPWRTVRPSQPGRSSPESGR